MDWAQNKYLVKKYITNKHPMNYEEINTTVAPLTVALNNSYLISDVTFPEAVILRQLYFEPQGAFYSDNSKMTRLYAHYNTTAELITENGESCTMEIRTTGTMRGYFNNVYIFNDNIPILNSRTLFEVTDTTKNRHTVTSYPFSYNLQDSRNSLLLIQTPLNIVRARLYLTPTRFFTSSGSQYSGNTEYWDLYGATRFLYTTQDILEK